MTETKLHTSWYTGGARVYDSTDLTNPGEEVVYMPEDTLFGTPAAARFHCRRWTWWRCNVPLSRPRGQQPRAFSGVDPPHKSEVDSPDAAE